MSDMERRRPVVPPLPMLPGFAERKAEQLHLIARHPDGRWETMVGTRSDLNTRIMRGARRREFGYVGPVASLDGHRLWRVEVWRIRDEIPRWRKPAIIAGSVLIVLAAVTGLGVWLFHSTTRALAGHGDMILAGGAVVVVGALALAFRRPIVEVIVKVR